MKQCTLKINDEFSYLGAKYCVHSIEPPDVLIIRIDVEDKRVHKMDYIALITDPSFIASKGIQKKVKSNLQQQEKKHRSILDTLSPEKRDTVSKRFEMIKPIIFYERAKDGDFVSTLKFSELYSDFLQQGETILDVSKEELFKRISNRSNKSVRQLKRYLADYYKAENELANHGIEGLVKKSYVESNIRTDTKAIEICHPKNMDKVLAVIYVRLDERYIPIIKNAIEKHYLNKKKVSIAHVHEMIEIMCYKKRLETIGYDTIYHIIKERLEPELKDRLRYGDAASQFYDPILRGISEHQAKAPLHIVQIDHTQLHMDIIDEGSGENIGRPWITMGIDVFTRMIWCLHISMEDPSANKVRKAFEHGIFLKRSRQRYNTLNEWDIHGIPSIICLDNGPDFKSAEVKRMIEETLETEVRYRPVSTPRYGGIIERAFGTINENFIHNLAGTRKSNPKELGEYDAEKEAIFTLNDVIEILTTYITDVYHHKVHDSLPLEYPTPSARYYQALETLGFPEFIVEEDESYYRMELLPVTTRKLSRDGIRYENVYYSMNEIDHLLRNKKYKIKYDIDDISVIYVLDPSKHEYIEVPAQYPSADVLKGVSRKTYRIIRQILKEQGKENIGKIPGSKDILKGKKLLVDKINQKVKKNKTIRKQALNSGLTLVSVPTEQLKSRETKEKKQKSKLEALTERLNYERAKKEEV